MNRGLPWPLQFALIWGVEFFVMSSPSCLVCLWSMKWVFRKIESSKVEMRHGLLVCVLYRNEQSKTEHFGCVFIPKVPAQCRCKTDWRICLTKTATLIQMCQALQWDMIPRTDPTLSGKEVLRRPLLPEAGGFLLPAHPGIVIRVPAFWLGFRTSLCSFNTPLFSTY